MPVNNAMLSTAEALRGPLTEKETPAARNLRMAFSAYAGELAGSDVSEVDAMFELALLLAVCIVGISSGFKGTEPNPVTAMATIKTAEEIAADILSDFSAYFDRETGSAEVRH